MPTRDELIQEIRDKAEEYTPNEATSAALQKVTAVLVVGPPAVGRSSTMHMVEKQDHAFGIATRFTTRPPREDEGRHEYDFLPHGSPILTAINERLDEGSLVDCSVGPNGYVYCSLPESYDHKYALLAPNAQEADKLRELPFTEVKLFGLVAPVREYTPRLERFIQSMPEQVAGQVLTEARTNLEWLLDQPYDSIAWVGNNNEANGAVPGTWAAGRIIALTYEDQPAQKQWRASAYHILKAIEERQ